MANYLQRLAISAARTTSAAKPPVSAPAVVPHTIVPVLPADFNALEAEALPDLESQPSILSPARTDSGLIAPDLAAGPAMPDHTSAVPSGKLSQPGTQIFSDAQTVTQKATGPVPAIQAKSAPISGVPAARLVPARSPLIQAPKALRRSGQTGQPRNLPWPVEHTILAPAMPRPSSTEEPLENKVLEPARPESASASALQTKPASPAEPGFNTLPPKEVSQTESPVFRTVRPIAAFAASVVSDAQIPAPKAIQELPSPMEHTASRLTTQAKATEAEVVSPETRVRPVAPRPGKSPVDPFAGSEEQPPSTSSLPVENQAKDDLRVEVRAMPAKQAVLPVTSSSTASRSRSQISIGRIEVQVNNTPPTADPIPPAAAPPAHLNFLEARYLNRFSLKP